MLIKLTISLTGLKYLAQGYVIWHTKIK